MSKIKNMNAAKEPSNRADIGSLQALEQRAGDSADRAPAETSTGVAEPEPGSDDARCEDTEECDLVSQQAADEVAFRLSRLRIGLQSEGVHDEAASEGETPGHSARATVRTDARIRAEIESKLKADEFLSEASIFVTVSRGYVLIEGSVENHENKQRAEAICRQASGIAGHNSNLVVRGPS